MGKRFIDELQQLPATMQWAAEQDVALLRRAVQLYGDRGLLAVGSGGSFTAAAFAADQHFQVYGHPSQAITPLEVLHVPTNAAANAAGLLLSAEGKNHDILAAAKHLQLRGCPTIGLTLRSSSPLVELSDATGAASLAAYDMPWGKDGYLATNSLVATLILLWRAYAADAEVAAELPLLVDWYLQFDRRIEQAAAMKRSRRALILHGAVGRIGAIDLESKLAEGALAFARGPADACVSQLRSGAKHYIQSDEACARYTGAQSISWVSEQACQHGNAIGEWGCLGRQGPILHGHHSRLSPDRKLVARRRAPRGAYRCRVAFARRGTRWFVISNRNRSGPLHGWCAGELSHGKHPVDLTRGPE